MADEERTMAGNFIHDIIDKDIERELARKLPSRIPHVFISSASGEGLDKLKEALWKALQ